MRKAALIVAIVTLPLLCWAGQDSGATADAAAGRVFDFGKIPTGTKVAHAFIFKNDGMQRLAIKDVTTSCGCTASKIEKKELDPGEETTINVTFNSTGYGGPAHQYVYLHTDSETEPVIKLTVKADVQVPK